MDIVAIPRDEIRDWWPWIEPGLAETLKHGIGQYNSDDVLNRLLNDTWLLFMVMDNDSLVACQVVRIVESQKRLFEIAVCWGSDMDKWLDDILEAFIRIAKDFKCVELAINGRPGWVRLGKPRDFKVKAVTITRAI